jgi:hypothetical protein
MEEWSYTSTILNFSIRWKLQAPVALCPGIIPSYRGDFAGSRAGLYIVEKRKSLAPAENRTPIPLPSRP